MRFHFIGVCGTAMGTLAAMLQQRGHEVSGSDAGIYPPMSDFLAREGVRLRDGYDASQVGPVDMVVVGNAISRGNPELEAVLDRRIRYQSLPECLRDQFLWDARPIVVAGTHGKTTTTTLTAWLLTHGGLDPGMLVGGIPQDSGRSYRLGTGRDFVIEGDEYDSAFFDKTAKFLKYVPDVVVLNNIEYDHADIYPDLDAILTAFRRLLRLIPSSGHLVANGDDARVRGLLDEARCSVDTVGVGAEMTWRASALEPRAAGVDFRLWHEGTDLGQVWLPMLGEYNVRNALAAIAVGHRRGLSLDTMREALASFRGVKRRLEVRGTVAGITVIDDFAHHPTAIAQTLQGVRQAHPSARIWAIFEPRSASSCRRVFQEAFASAFEAADRTLVAPVHRMSLPESERLSVETLVSALTAQGRVAHQVADAPAIADLVAAEAEPGDMIVVMSNGGFDRVHDRLLDALSRRHGAR